MAADYNGNFAPPRVVPGVNGPDFGAINTEGCRIVPQPQRNLSGDYSFYKPIMICMSRGVYADTFYPPY
jgi:hypothetical protein